MKTKILLSFTLMLIFTFTLGLSSTSAQNIVGKNTPEDINDTYKKVLDLLFSEDLANEKDTLTSSSCSIPSEFFLNHKLQ